MTALSLGAWACNQLCKVSLARKLQGHLISEITLCQVLLVDPTVKSKFCFGHDAAKIHLGGMNVGAWDLLPLSEVVVPLDDKVDVGANDASEEYILVGYFSLHQSDPSIKIVVCCVRKPMHVY